MCCDKLVEKVRGIKCLRRAEALLVMKVDFWLTEDSACWLV